MSRAGFLIFLASSVASAHESWLEPVDGGVALKVGERFTGEPRSFRRERTASLRLFKGGTVAEVDLPDAGEVPLLLVGRAGLVAYDSKSSFITLSADAFSAYLQEEGLTSALADRADAGQSNEPGRERYRRCLKALLQRGAFSIRTGQALEILPLGEPLAAGPGRRLLVQVLLNGQPLAGSLLKAWSHAGANLVVISADTTADGQASFELPHAGRWMLSTVHMARVDEPDVDWESTWASLTFEAQPARTFQVRAVR